MTKVNVKIVVVAKREKNLWAGEILHEVNKQYDVMKTSHARAYCTRLFNKELDNHTHEPSTVIAATYYASLGLPGNGGSAGRLAGREGKVLSRTGVFDQ